MKLSIKKSERFTYLYAVRRRFNGGYLFLQKIYHELDLDKVCEKIADKHKFEFDLGGILSRLVYTRIMYLGFQTFIPGRLQVLYGAAKERFHEICRALSVLSGESDFIQSQVYRNSLKIMTRKTGIIYYDAQIITLRVSRRVD